ncbi:MAG: hypothetical protein ACLR78_06050 [Roseburia sp.]
MTFRIATDSNAGDFLEDYEFEDEEISRRYPGADGYQRYVGAG